MNVIKMTRAEWEKKARELFGEDTDNWKFVCPACETVISISDYRKNKAPEGGIAYACIGRYLPDRQKAFGEKKLIKGKPCDYTTGGLFNISPIEITDLGDERYFNFYEE